MVSATGLYTFAVSTRSRPKAAGPFVAFSISAADCFNTQPPEGGWDSLSSRGAGWTKFQHAAARRRLGSFVRLTEKL